jgi:GAF domain-containing protein/HAMP domain-containing protein
VPIYDRNVVIGVLRSTLKVDNLLNLLANENFGNTGKVDLRINETSLLNGAIIEEDDLTALDAITGSYGQTTFQGAQSLVSQVSLQDIANPDDPSELAIARLGWTMIVHQDVSEALATAENQTKTTTLIALGVLFLTTLLGYLASQWILIPIVSLSKTVQAIGSGDLYQRSNIETNDEIGTLAKTFNSVTSQLQDTLGGLERRIAERTADVELARLLSERRAQELQAISEVSRTVSTEQRLEILLPLVARLVSERFDFYHVGIFFVDATKQFAVLQAANSEGGKRMLARGHRLEVGLTGIVGTVAQTGIPRIALDVGADATFFDNPDLPGTRSEMALPLNFRGETIGILDVQSVKPGAFTEGDASTLSILADQVAIAIENARLFGQTQQAREEAEALYNQFLRTEWKTFSQQETTIGYSQTMTGGKSIVKPIDSEEIREALQKGQVVVFEGKTIDAQPSISIPVQLRGQTIGVLNIKAPTKNRKWNQEEINLVQAVSDRLALALDNARLLQESQRRALKEAKIGEVTAKIGASINMRNVLQTAVEELGRALPGSEVVIQFQNAEEN